MGYCNISKYPDDFGRCVNLVIVRCGTVADSFVFFTGFYYIVIGFNNVAIYADVLAVQGLENIP